MDRIYCVLFFFIVIYVAFKYRAPVYSQLSPNGLKLFHGGCSDILGDIPAIHGSLLLCCRNNFVENRSTTTKSILHIEIFRIKPTGPLFGLFSPSHKLHAFFEGLDRISIFVAVRL